MNDKEIRTKLIQSLEGYCIREEMPIWGCRADLTVFTETELYGYEIKGDHDLVSGKRLANQIEKYDWFHDYNWIVIHEHATDRLKIPEYWGILRCADGVIITERFAKRNYNRDLAKILDLCWKDELIQLSKNRIKNARKYSKRDLAELVAGSISEPDIMRFVCEKARYKRW